jgi:Uma2 family endonuclease
MPALPPTRLYTVDDIRALPDDGNRYEIIAGELFVTPAPSIRHQLLLGKLFRLLADYVDLHALGTILFAPTDVVFGELTLVEPDLLFVRADHGERVTERDIQGAPDLAVEVLSPTTKRTDRGRKRALYQEQGVAEYWVVDLDLRQIEVWRPGAREAEISRATLTWQPSPSPPPLALPLERVFGSA